MKTSNNLTNAHLKLFLQTSKATDDNDDDNDFSSKDDDDDDNNK